MADIASVGYFVLDTFTGRARTGMDRAEFERVAKAMGVPEKAVRRVRP